MRLRAALHQHLPAAWLRRGLTAWLLRPLSWLYGALVGLRGLAYRVGLTKSQRLPALVIVVGNVVAGGAGKTPTSIALVRHLQQRGLRVGVMSRGHGRTSPDTRAVLADSLPHEVGDEPLLIHQATGAPVWVAAARADAGRALLQAHPDVQVLVCDDGLQHLALARDIEICVMDERGVGNGWLLPAGPLREPWPRAVDLVLHTGMSSLTGGYRAERRLADHARRADGGAVPLAALAAVPVDAVAGLARPEAFFEMLRHSGLTLAHTTALPDHHTYSDWPAKTTDRALLCTEKDAAKLWPHAPKALAVPLQLTPEPGFWQALDALVDARLPEAQKHDQPDTRRGAWPAKTKSHPFPRYHQPMDIKLLELLVCPVTKGPLDFDRERQELRSRSARLAYPVRNGIPILLENEARTLSDEEIDQLAAKRPAL